MVRGKLLAPFVINRSFAKARCGRNARSYCRGGRFAPGLYRFSLKELLNRGCWITRVRHGSRCRCSQETVRAGVIFGTGLPRARVTFCILSASISRNAKTTYAKSFSRRSTSCFSPARPSSRSPAVWLRPVPMGEQIFMYLVRMAKLLGCCVERMRCARPCGFVWCRLKTRNILIDYSKDGPPDVVWSVWIAWAATGTSPQSETPWYESS